MSATTPSPVQNATRDLIADGVLSDFDRALRENERHVARLLADTREALA